MADGAASEKRPDFIPGGRWKGRSAQAHLATGLLALVLGGCGGDSSDQAVAGNPPAPAPSPSPSPGPGAAPPPGAPAAPEPDPNPAPAPEPAPTLTVDSDVLATALCTSTQPISGQPRVLAAAPGRPDQGLVTAAQNCTADSVPVYFLSSGGYQGLPEVPYYADLFLRVDLLSRIQPLELGSLMTVVANERAGVSSYALAAGSTFVLPGKETLTADRTLHEWHSATANDAVVRLRLESRTPTTDRPEPMFKVCWHVVLPRVDRSTCHVHVLSDGSFKGLEIVDDSAGTGPITRIGWF